MSKKSALEAAATAPDFYNPHFDLVDIKRDFDPVANVMTSDKAEKLLKLKDIHSRLDRISMRITESLKKRAKKSSLVDNTPSGAWLTTLLTGIGTGVYMGATSGDAENIFKGGCLGAIAGLVGGFATALIADKALINTTVGKYYGLSKEDKAAIKSGIKLTQELKSQVDAEFEKTLQNLSREDISASPLRERLFEKFPRIAYDFKTAQLAEAAKPVAPAQSAPAPEPEKPPRLKITLNP